jgi:cell division protein FtsB
MSTRLATLILLLLLLLLQGQWWLGRGGLLNVQKMTHQLTTLKLSNASQQQSNEQTQAEIRDLGEGKDMLEEKARMELGMIKAGEILVQYNTIDGLPQPKGNTKEVKDTKQSGAKTTP